MLSAVDRCPRRRSLEEKAGRYLAGRARGVGVSKSVETMAVGKAGITPQDHR